VTGATREFTHQTNSTAHKAPLRYQSSATPAPRSVSSLPMQCGRWPIPWGREGPYCLVNLRRKC